MRTSKGVTDNMGQARQFTTNFSHSFIENANKTQQFINIQDLHQTKESFPTKTSKGTKEMKQIKIEFNKITKTNEPLKVSKKHIFCRFE